MSSQLVRPNLTMRTMQLNAWVAVNFMNIEIVFLPLIKITLHSVYYLAFAQPCEHNNERNARAVDNLAPLDMPFLSIIA